jgi:hypothetical protein
MIHQNFIFYYTKLLGGSGKPPKSDEDSDDHYENDGDDDYNKKREISKEDYDELFTSYVFICKANDQLKYEWWWDVDHIILLDIFRWMSKVDEEMAFDIEKLKYILLVEQEKEDERKYVLRKNPYYLGEESRELADIRRISKGELLMCG